MYGVRYKVGARTYEKYGFDSMESARRFLMNNTSAYTWWFLKQDEDGAYRIIK